MTYMLSFLFVVFLGICSTHYQVLADFPVCSNVSYTPQNTVDVFATLLNCASSMEGSQFPPSFFSGSEFKPTIINVSIAFNNIIGIDDVGATMTLDFWMRVYWSDPRWNLPDELWNSVTNATYYEGLQLAPMVRNQNSPLTIWLPDIYILEAIQTNVLDEIVGLFPNRHIWWSRHIVAQTKQAKMDLRKYPMDTQEFSFTMQSFAYATRYVILSPFTNGMGYYRLNTDDITNQIYLKLNQLWNFKGVTTKTYLQDVSNFFDPERYFSTIAINLIFSRQNFGIVFRLVLPVLMFLLLVGFSFWAELDKRIDVTITMVLAVSALYLVIGQVIPFVGYFSVLDRFVTSAFVILCSTAAIHYLVNNLHSEKDKYPFNKIFEVVIVYICRVTFIPVIFFIAVKYYFGEYARIVIGPSLLILIFTTVIIIYYTKNLSRTFRNCVCQLKAKHFCEAINCVYEPAKVMIPLNFSEKIIFFFICHFNINCSCEMSHAWTIQDLYDGMKSVPEGLTEDTEHIMVEAEKVLQDTETSTKVKLRRMSTYYHQVDQIVERNKSQNKDLLSPGQDSKKKIQEKFGLINNLMKIKKYKQYAPISPTKNNPDLNDIESPRNLDSKTTDQPFSEERIECLVVHSIVTKVKLDEIEKFGNVKCKNKSCCICYRGYNSKIANEIKAFQARLKKFKEDKILRECFKDQSSNIDEDTPMNSDDYQTSRSLSFNNSSKNKQFSSKFLSSKNINTFAPDQSIAEARDEDKC